MDLDYLSYLDGIPTTSIEETDTQKIVHYAVRDLVESYNPGYKAEFDEEKQIPDVIQMAGWNSGVSYQLPTNNSSHLTGVSVNVRGYYTDAKNGRKNKLALFYQKDGTDTIAGLDRLIQNSAYPDYADVVLMETTNPAEFSDIDRLYLRWGPNAYGSVFIRDITMTYEKSEADRALDAAVAAARDVRDPSDELTDVLAQAQQLKFSTTSDMSTAIGATQQEIEEIAARLDRLAGQKGASIETVDEDRAVLREKTLTFESDVTAGSVKAAVTATDPADAELQVYTDRTMTEPVADGAYITSGNVVAVQAEGYSYNLYTVLLQSEKEVPVTEAEETADKKIVRFAAADLSQIYGNVEGGNITVVFDQKYNVENVIDIGAWGSFNKFYLPSEHIQDILSISINARGAGTAAGRSNPITVCGEDQEGTEHPAGFSLPLNETEQGEYAEHQMTNYMLQDNLGDAEKIYLRWGQAWGNCYIKTVTVTYEKTDSERELDHAIAEAEKLADRSDDIAEALAEAKQYKVSLADDVFAALAATEEQIQEVTQRLDALVESVNRKGDLTRDGKIMTDDALYALELASGKRMGSAEEIELGDMNGDGVITAVDALLIIKSALS